MASNKHRQDRARESEFAVAAYLAERIWPDAEAGGRSTAGSDVKNVPVDIEVKARRDFDPLAWLRQSRKRRAGGFVVCRPDGAGVANVGKWLVIKTLDDEIDLRLQLQQYRNYRPVGVHPIDQGIQEISIG